jgi:uncharacterized membrane protein YphA (DoxX/SURF4 family)
MNVRNKAKLKLFLRIFTGLVFILSAWFKIQSLDAFEIYVYSFGLLKLNTTFLFSRLLISIELLIGILLIVGIYLKHTVYSSISILGGFTVFIIILILTNNKEHCHCFGDLVEMSHLTSIIKNLILIGFLLLIFKSQPLVKKYHRILLTSVVLFSFAIPFILSPPDSFRYQKYSEMSRYNKQMLNEFLKENQLKDKSMVLCFFGTNCRFCKLAVKKVAVISEKSEEMSLLHYAFWGNENQIEEFFAETNTPVVSHSSIPGPIFLRITKGRMPLILLIKDGKVKQKYGYRDIDEKEIIDFMNSVKR